MALMFGPLPDLKMRRRSVYTRKELKHQSEAMRVRWTHMECQGDVHTSVYSAATTKHGLVAAGLASSWEVMAGHAKDRRMNCFFFTGRDVQE